MEQEIKKSAKEWLNDPRVQDTPGKVFTILDDDGWRHADGVTLDDPVTWEDFNVRLGQSTVGYFPSSAAQAPA